MYFIDSLVLRPFQVLDLFQEFHAIHTVCFAHLPLLFGKHNLRHPVPMYLVLSIIHRNFQAPVTISNRSEVQFFA